MSTGTGCIVGCLSGGNGWCLTSPPGSAFSSKCSSLGGHSTDISGASSSQAAMWVACHMAKWTRLVLKLACMREARY